MNHSVHSVCSKIDGYTICFDSTDHPFYHSSQPTLIDGVSDPILTLAGPILAYWTLSLFFHYLDTAEWKWLEKYRIHESAEIQSKNLVSRTQVVWAVIFQQIVQTGLHHIAQYLAVIMRILGTEREAQLLPMVTYAVYWWVIPTLQLLLAILPFDPLQIITSNNADYHDIHHQIIGIKSNFSQPFFIHWDSILGTRMTRQELESRKRRD
ncbi:sphingosine hydroxylase [Lentinula edodes]|uniref:Sphingosine hydroxylase n=1 Tax=Lentinula edodes TaxID=5353 RepID=A0A1Q3ES07_LENED|nr:sphingosine hydroxylase [Lentinula edodes]